MVWWNYPNSVLEKLSGELLLLVVSLLWVLLRLSNIVTKKVEEGKPLSIKILGREFLEVKESLNLEVQHSGENI